MKNTPNAEQLKALKQFAAANGRSWKSELNHLSMNGAYSYAVLDGADPACLQQVPNEFGPSWLAGFSLRQSAQESTEQMNPTHYRIERTGEAEASFELHDVRLDVLR